jgi:hypothetical protein
MRLAHICRKRVEGREIGANWVVRILRNQGGANVILAAEPRHLELCNVAVATPCLIPPFVYHWYIYNSIASSCAAQLGFTTPIIWLIGNNLHLHCLPVEIIAQATPTWELYLFG